MTEKDFQNQEIGCFSSINYTAKIGLVIYLKKGKILGIFSKISFGASRISKEMKLCFCFVNFYLKPMPIFHLFALLHVQLRQALKKLEVEFRDDFLPIF